MYHHQHPFFFFKRWGETTENGRCCHISGSYSECGCWGEYFDRRGIKWREIGGNCIMRSFITYTPRQT
jgi:hypothetical protein